MTSPLNCRGRSWPPPPERGEDVTHTPSLAQTREWLSTRSTSWGTCWMAGSGCGSASRIATSLPPLTAARCSVPRSRISTTPPRPVPPSRATERGPAAHSRQSRRRCTTRGLCQSYHRLTAGLNRTDRGHLELHVALDRAGPLRMSVGVVTVRAQRKGAP